MTTILDKGKNLIQPALLYSTNWPCVTSYSWWYYLPTPPLGQYMTQGQFLSGGGVG